MGRNTWVYPRTHHLGDLVSYLLWLSLLFLYLSACISQFSMLSNGRFSYFLFLDGSFSFRSKTHMAFSISLSDSGYIQMTFPFLSPHYLSQLFAARCLHVSHTPAARLSFELPLDRPCCFHDMAGKSKLGFIFFISETKKINSKNTTDIKYSLLKKPNTRSLA